MPNRLQYLGVIRTAAAFNPILAMDAKVDYAPLFKGVTTKNFKQRKTQIIADAKKLLKGKTIAKDAPMEHFAQLLNSLEHVPDQANLDESVSEPQHKAMEAAAHGTSNLGIPKDVGKEFSEADKGKSFDAMLMDWFGGRDAAKPFGEDDLEALKKMHGDSMPENALDEHEDDEEAEDESEEAEDESEEEERKPVKDTKRGGAHDAKSDKSTKATKTFVTTDEMNAIVAAAVKTERKANLATAEAREFVRPFVGQVAMALDSEVAVLQAAASAMAADGKLEIEADELKTLPAAALRTLIKHAGRAMAQDEQDNRRTEIAEDEHEGASGFDTRWGTDANRIGHA